MNKADKVNKSTTMNGREGVSSSKFPNIRSRLTHNHHNYNQNQDHSHSRNNERDKSITAGDQSSSENI